MLTGLIIRLMKPRRTHPYARSHPGPLPSAIAKATPLCHVHSVFLAEVCSQQLTQTLRQKQADLFQWRNQTSCGLHPNVSLPTELRLAPPLKQKPIPICWGFAILLDKFAHIYLYHFICALVYMPDASLVCFIWAAAGAWIPAAFVNSKKLSAQYTYWKHTHNTHCQACTVQHYMHIRTQLLFHNHFGRQASAIPCVSECAFILNKRQFKMDAHVY